jgi:SAM-dependent methyltransferase
MVCLNMTHLTRYNMYKQIEQCLKENDLLPLEGKVLGITGVQAFRPLLSKNAEIVETTYPETDMQKLAYADNIFDYVISDQVIEHLEDPKKAISESYRVLKKNGIAIHTTCFMNYVHNVPIDMWRFSPECLKFLCKDFSKILLSGGWGNRVAILACFISEHFRNMNIPESRWSLRNLIATRNDKRYPIVVWIVAKK